MVAPNGYFDWLTQLKFIPKQTSCAERCASQNRQKNGLIMNPQLPLIILLISSGCSGSKSDDTNSSTQDTFPDTITDSLWADSVTELTTHASVVGDLSHGATIDLSFASESDMACWPATENTNFEGNHVYYAMAMPADSSLTATVVPESDVDVSIYMYQLASDSYYTPDEVPYSVSCEAGYDMVNNSNPGNTESASVTSSTNPYNVFIGVAGAAGEISGGYTLSLILEND